MNRSLSGCSAAREVIAREYGAPVDRVVMTASTSEAYSWLFKLLCDPGDEVLVPRPSYPLFDYLAALESANVRHYGLFYDHGWFIDFHTIERAINDRTRAIVLVNPNNPTGHFLRRHELAQLTAFGLPIISDEVFRDYQLQPAPDSVLTLAGCRRSSGLHVERSFEDGGAAANEAGVDDREWSAGSGARGFGAARNHRRYLSFGGYSGAVRAAVAA